MNVPVVREGGTVRAASRHDALRELVRPVAAGLTLLILLLGIIVPAIRDPRPHDIAVGLVGPAAATDQIEQGFASAAPGAFDFITYGSEAEARRAIDARAVDGVLVLRPDAPLLVVAGAAGGGSSAAITGAIGNALRAQGADVAVETVRPFSSQDPQGMMLFLLVLGLTVSALAAGAMSAMRTSGAAALVATATYAVLGGIVGGWMIEWLVGGYGERIWQVAGLGALGAAAVGLAAVGSARLLGPAGVGLAAIVLGPLNLAASGGPIGSSFLPDVYRALAPWMPAVETYSALRGALFFDGAGVGEQVAFLSAWALAGVVLAIAGDLARRRRGLR